ncbi:MAG: signal recognition particle-docking protein FtsY [Mogibacterium sp.]|nr:signal recognition particle-docking protein FtsY [Mogibacterium sp.]
MGIFKKKSTFQKISQSITDLLAITVKIDDEFYENLEETLIMADIGIDTTEKILVEMKKIADRRNLYNEQKIKEAIVEVIAKIVDKGDRNKLCPDNPLIILMIGINGGGKTTSIGKLANRCKNDGRTVLLAAADTFRAAAAEQLTEWGNRVGVRTIRHEEGTDPSAVIYDAIQSAKANNIDVLICDTAGRLQNKRNLMKELEKMDRVITREYPEANRETLLVLDATTGKNAISQAEEFNDIANITGIILTKLDGTARGGIAITIADQFDMPIKFIGMGEGLDDLIPFDPMEFAGGIFDE